MQQAAAYHRKDIISTLNRINTVKHVPVLMHAADENSMATTYASSTATFTPHLAAIQAAVSNKLEKNGFTWYKKTPKPKMAESRTCPPS